MYEETYQITVFIHFDESPVSISRLYYEIFYWKRHENQINQVFWTAEFAHPLLTFVFFTDYWFDNKNVARIKSRIQVTVFVQKYVTLLPNYYRWRGILTIFTQMKSYKHFEHTSQEHR